MPSAFVRFEGFSAAQKLGHPVPLSNFVSDEKTGRPQPAHRYTPARCSLFSGLDPARSVSSSRSTSNCCGVSSRRHSASDLATSKAPSSADSASPDSPPLRRPTRTKPAPARRKTRLVVDVFTSTCGSQLDAASESSGPPFQPLPPPVRRLKEELGRVLHDSTETGRIVAPWRSRSPRERSG